MKESKQCVSHCFKLRVSYERRMNTKERKAMQNTGNEPSMVGKEQRYSKFIGLTGVHNVPEVGLIVSLGR